MTDDLHRLQQRIERLEAAVGDIRDRLANCIQVAVRPEDALALARGVAEALVKRVLEDMNIKPPAMLDACLRELERPGVMSRGLVPSEVLSLLHMVRVMGNKASHGSMRIRPSGSDVHLVLQALLRVVEWYFAEFDRGPKLDPLFQDPQAADMAGQGTRASSVALIDASLDPHDSPYEQVIEDGKKVIRLRPSERNDTNDSHR